jgi:hypothetical protein
MPITTLNTQLTSFFAINFLANTTPKDSEFSTYNFLDKAKISALVWPLAMPSNLLEDVMAYQRIYKLCGSNQEQSNVLYELGFYSAQQINALSTAAFKTTVGNKLSDVYQATIRARAKEISDKANILAMNAQANSAAPYFKNMRINAVSPKIIQEFESIAGYDDIFGSVRYCQCDECKSVFSPAAYYVDLMRITNKYVNVVPGTNPDVKLALMDRRPDLATIALSCDNTNKLVPQAQLVCEVLENTVKKLANVSDVYHYLTNKPYPFQSPYHLPLQQVRTYLNETGSSLATVINTLNGNTFTEAGVVESLNLSWEHYQLIKTPPTVDVNVVTIAYGLTSLDATVLEKLTNPDTLAMQLGISRNDLNTLFTHNLSKQELDANSIQKKFFINKKLSGINCLNIINYNSTPEETKEYISNLSIDSLDAIYRFVRLANALQWTYEELDWVLSTLNAADLSAEVLKQIAIIKTMSTTFNIPVIKLTALWFNVKTTGTNNDTGSLFDVLFNTSVSQTSASKAKLYHPRTADNVVYNDKLLLGKDGKILLNKLGVSQNELRIISLAFLNLDVLEMSLSLENLSLLYRHSMLAEALNISVTEYLFLLELTNLKKAILSATDCLSLQQTAIWVSQSGLSIYEIHYVITGKENDYVQSNFNAQSFSDILPKIKNDLVQNQLSSDDFNLKLANYFNCSVDQFTFLSNTISKLEPNAPSYFDLLNTNAFVATTQVLGVTETLSKWLFLINKLKFNQVQVVAHLSEGIIEKLALSKARITNFESLKKVVQYKKLFDEAQDTLPQLLDCLRYGLFSSDSQKYYCALWNYNENEYSTFTNYLASTASSALNTIEDVYMLKATLNLIQQTKLDISVLVNLKDFTTTPANVDNWKWFNTNANKIIDAIKIYAGDEQWELVHKKINAEITEGKRRVLIAQALYLLGGEYNDELKLSEYLLMDVSSSSSDVSVLKYALNSVQLYLQRCRLGLEKNASINTNEFNENWWDWILNYRIWEANRKVFLYPENYIDPSLRTNKTELFKRLENNLKQGQIDKEHVEEVFRQYMDDFGKLANLEYVDAYNCIVNEDGADYDTLFIFACTQTQPIEYYYITRKNLVSTSSSNELWGEWKKLDVSINAEYIAPVFIFNKLFVFWMEINESKELDQSPRLAASTAVLDPNKNVTIWKGEIKFTFTNFSQDWTQPQSFAKNLLLSIDSNANLYGDYHAQSMNIGNNHWKKIGVNVLYPEGSDTKSIGEETLLIHFGPFVNNITPNFPSINLDNFLKKSAFREHLEIIKRTNDKITAIRTLKNSSVLYPSHEVNYFSVHPIMMMNSDLKRQYFLSDREFLTFEQEGYFADTTNTIQFYEYDTNTLKITYSRATLFTNYSQGLYEKTNGIIDGILPATKPFYTSTLFSSLPNNIKAKVPYFAVRNNVGKVIVNTNDEAFLVELVDTDTQIKKTSTQISPNLVRNINPTVLVSDLKNFAKDTTDIGNDLLVVLKGMGILDADGKVTVVNFPSISLQDTTVLPTSTAFLMELRNSLVYSTVSGINISKHYFGNYFFGYAGGLPNVSIDPVSGENYYPIKDGVTEDRLVKLKNYIENIRLNPSIKYKTGKILFQYNALKFNAQRISTNALPFLANKLFIKGIDGLLSIESQQVPLKKLKTFSQLGPQSNIQAPIMDNGDQVSFEGPYGNYYWELFYHAPLLVAQALNNNQQFLDAQKWQHYVFNPTIADGTTSKNYWQFLPFRNRQVETLAQQLADDAEIAAYNNSPFDPHAIARLRAGAYEKATVMQYLDNLLDWGDSLFEKYTWESITAATMLYSQAYNLLGPRPTEEKPKERKKELNFADINQYFSTANKGLLQFFTHLENAIVSRYENTAIPSGTVNSVISAKAVMPFSNLEAYFNVPENDDFIAYWDRVSDRFYKIQHGLTIKGISQPIALFEPPINPMALVRAAAAGLSLSDVAYASQANMPAYRFLMVLEKAKSFTQTAIQLGSTLLSALEKKDAEALSALHASQELRIQEMILGIKEKQIEEQQKMLDGLNLNVTSATYRRDHYNKLINENWNAEEKAGIRSMRAALGFQSASIALKSIAAPLAGTPNIFGLANGGQQLHEVFSLSSQAIGETASLMHSVSGLLSTTAQYQRRKEEWQLQAQLAQFEIDQLNTQIQASKIRLDSSIQELATHKQTIENSKAIDVFLKSKFTNADLYQWLLSRLSGLYFQTYKLASSTAMMAQQAYNFELDSDDNFMANDNWDNLHKGLLAGEGLMFSLQQLEKAYLVNNVRRFELEKTISLRQAFPEEFLNFKYGDGADQGNIRFQLKQSHFDFDFPNHYCRKIKAISITIPAVVGPYQTINATLTQNSSSLLLKPDLKGVNYILDPTQERPQNNVLRENWVPNQQIALSKGVDDSGLFMLNFNDERYLPFEGTGAVSTWTLQMPPETNRFDFESISDILVKVYYDAFDGGEKFGKDIVNLYKQKNKGLVQAKIINLKQSVPAAWDQMMESSSNSLKFKLTDAFVLPDLNVNAKGIIIQLKTADNIAAITQVNMFSLVMEGSNLTWQVDVKNGTGFIPNSAIQNNPALPKKLEANWVLNLNASNTPESLKTNNKLDTNKLLDVVIALVYDTNFGGASSTTTQTPVNSISGDKLTTPTNVIIQYNASTANYTVTWNTVPSNNGYAIEIIDKETNTVISPAVLALKDSTSAIISETSFTSPAFLILARVKAIATNANLDSNYALSANPITKLKAPKSITFKYDSVGKKFNVCWWQSIAGNNGYTVQIVNKLNKETVIAAASAIKDSIKLDIPLPNSFSAGDYIARVKTMATVGQAFDSAFANSVSSVNCLEAVSTVSLKQDFTTKNLIVKWDAVNNTQGYVVDIVDKATGNTISVTKQIPLELTAVEIPANEFKGVGGVYVARVKGIAANGNLDANYAFSTDTITKLQSPVITEFSFDKAQNTFKANWQNTSNNNGYEVCIVDINTNALVTSYIKAQNVLKHEEPTTVAQNLLSDYAIKIRSIGATGIADSDFAKGIADSDFATVSKKALYSTSVSASVDLSYTPIDGKAKISWASLPNTTGYLVQLINKDFATTKVVYESITNETLTELVFPLTAYGTLIAQVSSRTQTQGQNTPVFKKAIQELQFGGTPQNIQFVYDHVTCKYKVTWNTVVNNKGYQVQIFNKTSNEVIGVELAAKDSVMSELKWFGTGSKVGIYEARVQVLDIVGDLVGRQGNSINTIERTPLSVFCAPYLEKVAANNFVLSGKTIVAPNGCTHATLNNAFCKVIKWLGHTFVIYNNAANATVIYGYDSAGNLYSANWALPTVIKNVDDISINFSATEKSINFIAGANSFAFNAELLNDALDKIKFWSFESISASNPSLVNNAVSLTNVGTLSKAVLEASERNVGGTAVRLTGADDSFVSFPAAMAQFGTKNFTVAFWFRTTELPNTSTNAHDLVGNRFEGGGYTNFISFRMWSNGRVTFEMSQDTNGTNAVTLDTKTSDTRVWADGIWHHVACVREGKNVSLYMDGELKATAASADITNINNPYLLKIGRALTVTNHPFRFALNSAFDDVFICERALNITEISSTLYSTNPTSPVGTDFTYDKVTSKFRLNQWDKTTNAKGYQLQLYNTSTNEVVANELVAPNIPNFDFSLFGSNFKAGIYVAKIIAMDESNKPIGLLNTSKANVNLSASDLLCVPYIERVSAINFVIAGKTITPPIGFTHATLNNGFCKVIKWLANTFVAYSNGSTVTIFGYNSLGNSMPLNWALPASTATVNDITINFTTATKSFNFIQGTTTRVFNAETLNNALDKMQFWNFKEVTLPTIYNALNIVNVGTASNVGIEPSIRRDLQGRDVVGKAVRITGANDSFVSFPAAIGQFGTKNFTVAFWFKTNELPDTTTGAYDLFGNRFDGGHGNWIAFRIARDGGVVAEIDQDASGTNYAGLSTLKSDGSGWGDGSWHHLAFVREGKNVSLYMDGILRATAMSAGITSINNTYPLKIGRSLTTAVHSTRFAPNAAFDNLFICERAMSLDEIKRFA